MNVQFFLATPILDDDEDENDVEANGSFVIECFEITSGGAGVGNWYPWGRDIILKNATKKKLKVEVQYPGVDYNMDESKMYVQFM